MTPKEKAYQLINKFYFALPNNGLQEGINNVNDRWSEAKKCALIAVDEIIKALEDYGKNTMELQNMDREFAWWDDVKQEIQNL